MRDVWEELNSIDMPDICNDTELSIEELEQIDWIETTTENSKYSSLSATTYQDPTGAFAKKVFSDGFIEYYEIA